MEAGFDTGGLACRNSTVGYPFSGDFDYPFTTRYFFGLPANADKTSTKMMAFDKD